MQIECKMKVESGTVTLCIWWSTLDAEGKASDAGDLVMITLWNGRSLCGESTSNRSVNFHDKRPVMLPSDVYIDVILNVRLSKQSNCRWFESPWRPCDVTVMESTVLNGTRDGLQYQFKVRLFCISWRRHQMEPFSALLAICVVNSPVTGEFPAQRPVTQSFDVFFDRRLNRRLSK